MKDFLKALAYFVAALAFVLSAVFLSNWISEDEKPAPPVIVTPPPVQRPIVSCPSDRLSYSTLTKNVKLIENHTPMFAAGGKFINPQIILAKSETEDSKVACGYVFMRAGTENGALRNWEDIYVNPNTFGGHIASQKAISINDGSEFSEYLFSLDKIPYWPNAGRKTLLNADWAALLNVSPEVKFDIALNTNDRSGFIDEITIAYKCWNPKTGEENEGCKLSVASKTEQETTSPVK